MDELWFRKMNGVVPAATGYYDTASTLPQLHKLEALLVIEDQRARQRRRRPDLKTNHIFSDDGMKEI